jgi:hypothetical protein
MRSLFDQSGAAHELHLLEVPDMICKQRLLKRNAGGKHPFQVSEAEYDLFTRYFVTPEPREGFNVIVRTLTPAGEINALVGHTMGEALSVASRSRSIAPRSCIGTKPMPTPH